MNRSTQIWVGVVVLAGLAGAVFYKAKEDQKIGTAQTTNAELPKLEAGDDVDKISVQNGDKPEVVLEKKGDTWEVVKPVQAKANQEAVKSILGNLKDLKAKEVIVASADEPAKKEYDFAGGKQVHVVAYKGADKKLDATFGKSGARGQMAMVEGKPGIYAVSGYSSYLYTREVKNWRETSILKFEDSNAVGVEVTNKNGLFSFSKNGDKWSGSITKRDKDGKLDDKPAKEWKKFDEGKVKDLLRAYKGLNAEDFGDVAKDKAGSGVDAADKEGGIVKIKLKDNAGELIVKVGKVQKGTSRWAWKEGGDTLYAISSWSADWATAEPSKFEKGDEKKKDDKKKDAHEHGGD